jgi:hypothetical protein
MTDPADLRLQLPTNVFTRRFEEDVVLLDLDSGEYFALDPLGARLLDALVSGKTSNEFAAGIDGEFDVEEGRLRADLGALVAELLKRKLVEQAAPTL